MTKRSRLREDYITAKVQTPLDHCMVSRCGMNKGLLFWLCLLVLSSSLTAAALLAGRSRARHRKCQLP